MVFPTRRREGSLPPSFPPFPPASTALPPHPADSISSSAEEPSTDRGYWRSFKDWMHHWLIQTLSYVRTGIDWVLHWLHPAFEEGEATPQASESHPTTSSFSPIGDSFSFLELSEEEGRNIEEIICTMGTNDRFLLLLKGNRLRVLGESISHVHPLKFLERIFNHNTLPRDLESTLRDPFKWRFFLVGFSEKIHREFTTLPQYILGFSRAVNVNLGEIQPFFQLRNWKGLIEFLIDVKLGRRSSTFVEPPSPLIVVQHSPSLEDLPFSQEERNIFGQLLDIYATRRRWALVFDLLHLKSLWYRLDQVHPLKLLSSLYSIPEFRAQVLSITRWWGTNALFMGELVKQLQRRPAEEVIPYLSSFIEHCQLDLGLITDLVHQREWKRIAEAVIQQFPTE